MLFFYGREKVCSRCNIFSDFLLRFPARPRKKNVSVNWLGQRERSEEKMRDGEKRVLKDTREPLEAYWLFNTSLTFKNLLAKGLDFQVSGFNLLDEDYRASDPTAKLPDDIPCPGRSFYGRISYSF